jgi:hypothetical protein
LKKIDFFEKSKNFFLLKFFLPEKKIFKKKKYFLETTYAKSRKISKIKPSKK